jgi:Tfp pilus assembly protein FimT
VVSAVVMPSFVRSIRVNRLRAAARDVVMAGRYARSMAVLQQKEMAVTFNLTAGTISVTDLDAPAQPSGQSTNKLAAVGPADPAAAEPASTPAGAPPSGPGGDVSLTRTLDRVRIERVEVPDLDESRTDGACTVTYFTNGTCTPYQVRIVDEFDSVVIVNVDALSSAETVAETK